MSHRVDACLSLQGCACRYRLGKKGDPFVRQVCTRILFATCTRFGQPYASTRCGQLHAPACFRQTTVVRKLFGNFDTGLPTAKAVAEKAHLFEPRICGFSRICECKEE